MRGRGILLVCLLFAACGQPRPDQYPEALVLFRAGAFDQVITLAQSEAEALDATPEGHRFQLLKAWALYKQGKAEAAEALLSSLPLDPGSEAALFREMLQVYYHPTLKDKPHLFGQLYQRALALETWFLASEIAYYHYWYVRRGDPDLVEQLLTQSMHHGKQSGSAYQEVRAASSLGLHLHGRRRFSEGARILESAPLDHPTTEHYGLYARIHLGMCYLGVGSLEKAWAQLEHARDGLAGDPFEYNALGELGNYHFYKREFDAAAGYYKRAWDLIRHKNTDSPWGANLINTYLMQEAHAEALAVGETVAMSPITQAQIQVGLGRYDEAAPTLKSLLAAEDPGRRWRAHYLYSKIKERQGRREAMLHHLDEARAILEGMQVAEGTEDRMFYFAHINQFYRLYVKKLVDAGRGKDAFAVAEACRSRLLREQFRETIEPAMSWQALDASARETNRTYLLYWLDLNQSYVWAFSPEGSTAQPRLLPSKSIIGTHIQEFTAFIDARRNPLTEPSEAAQYLVDELLKPLSDFLREGRELVIAADSELWNLNLEALPYGDGFFLQRHTIAMAPSLSMAARSGDRGAGARASMLMIGDPEPVGSYGRLGGAGRELKAAVKYLRQADPRTVTGPAARPSAYTETTPGDYDLISFAAHGEANRDNPLYSAIILSQPQEDADYKLYARDILKQQLKAELVTISSCDGAGSRILAGEGLVGLAWSFLHAGAQHVVAGLGRVEDHATATLMTRFYDQLSQGDTVIDALHKAKLSMVADGREPRFWAPFQVYTR